MLPILKQGSPYKDSDRLSSIIAQIASKSIAFCVSIVNALGDVFLSEKARLSTFEEGFLKLLAPAFGSFSS